MLSHFVSWLSQNIFNRVLNFCFITFQGSVLSAFFWGYTMTQVLGGYLSDRIGGEIIITLAAVGWSLLTFWTPIIINFYQDKTMVLYLAVMTRVLMGCFQGKVIFSPYWSKCTTNLYSLHMSLEIQTQYASGGTILIHVIHPFYHIRFFSSVINNLTTFMKVY